MDKTKRRRIFYAFAIMIIIVVGLTSLIPIAFTPDTIIWTNNINAINLFIAIALATFIFAIYQIKQFSPLREHIDKIFIHTVLSIALTICLGTYFAMILSDGSTISPIIMFMMTFSIIELNIFLPVGYSFILEIEDTHFLPKQSQGE
jgi:hypothetical protein